MIHGKNIAFLPLENQNNAVIETENNNFPLSTIRLRHEKHDHFIGI